MDRAHGGFQMIYVMSDIHGNRKAFDDVMEQINLNADDQLYVLGDVIDRMPGGINILLDLLRMPNAMILMGNHEHMMIHALENRRDHYINPLAVWYANGGKITHDIFKKLSKSSQQIIYPIMRSFPTNVGFILNGVEFLLCHGAPLEYKRRNKSDEDMDAASVWTRLDGYTHPAPGKIVIFGHTPTDYYQTGKPFKIWHGNKMIGIDCGSPYPHAGGRLACLRLDDMTEFYSEVI